MINEQRTPVTLLTGFLGSGKTTLLNHWLRSPDLSKAIVIVNEFGDIGIDHALIAASNDNTIELSTGCLCCTIQGTLADSLKSVFASRLNGSIREFDQIVIETSGLADPAPLLGSLLGSTVARDIQLSKVVTVVDAINGIHNIEHYPESLRQVGVADVIVITKCDIDAAAAKATREYILRLNRGVPLFNATSTDRPQLCELGPPISTTAARRSLADTLEWLNFNAYCSGSNHSESHHDNHLTTRHSGDVTSYVLEATEPLDWADVMAWLNCLAETCGPNLLRVKGILDVTGYDRPLVVQMVQRLFHQPFEIPAWPQSGERRSQIVFITRGVPREFVTTVFDTVSNGRQRLWNRL